MQINIEQYCYFNSPIGQILLAGADDTLLLVGFPTGKMRREHAQHWQHKPQGFAECVQQLSEYFAGVRKVFNLKYHINGTEFQQQVLKAVAQIPYGSTMAYGDIARKINNPLAVRAVGGANGKNPLPIIIPCHRVLGKNGALTGFGGGLDTKRYLLDLEGLAYT